MSQEESIGQDLITKFSYLENNIRIPRPRRIFLETALDNFWEVFVYAVEELGFSHLCTITGLDEQERLDIIYHLCDASGILLNVRTAVLKENPAVKTVTAYFPGAEIYERELMDLLGVRIEGLPAGKRYPLTDDWPANEFPLRKNWKSSGEKQKESDSNA